MRSTRDCSTLVEIGGLHHYGCAITSGGADIAARVQALHDQGRRLSAAGRPIQYESIVAEPVRFLNTDGSESGSGMLVFDISEHKIAWQWVIGAPWMAGQ